MSTTVHLPPELLKRVDERARALRMSRNQYIRRALERMIEPETKWSGEFLRTLEQAAEDRDSHAAIDEMMRAISRRTRKGPTRL